MGKRSIMLRIPKKTLRPTILLLIHQSQIPFFSSFPCWFQSFWILVVLGLVLVQLLVRIRLCHRRACFGGSLAYFGLA